MDAQGKCGPLTSDNSVSHLLHPLINTKPTFLPVQSVLPSQRRVELWRRNPFEPHLLPERCSSLLDY